MKLEKFHRIVAQTPPEVKAEIRLSLDILDRIHELLDAKFEGKQKLLAEKMNKSEAEVSKWLSGVQNFTIRTLGKLEAAFGEPIIAVCTKSEMSTFVEVRVSSCTMHKSLDINIHGQISETVTEGEDYRNLLIRPSQALKATL